MSQDPPEMQAKQGALEYNAYLIKNFLREEQVMTAAQRRTTLTMLYLNLKKLAADADCFVEQTNERNKLMAKLERLDTPEARELTYLLEESQKSAPDGLRLNSFAKMCNQVVEVHPME